MRYVKNLIPLFLILVSPLAASAAVYGTSVDSWDGSRTTDVSEELSFQGAPPVLTIDWVIGDNGDGTYNYSYTLSQAQGSAAQSSISHFTLDISDGAFDDITNAKMTISYSESNEEKFTVFEQDNGLDLDSGDPLVKGADNETYDPLPTEWADEDSALKFENGVELQDGQTLNHVTYEFDSDRVAVWGNVFVKAGQVGANDGAWNVYNAGIGLENQSDNTANFIAVPDSVIVPNTEIPEPATMLVWSLLGLIGVGLIRRRR